MNINTKDMGFVTFNQEEMQWVKFNDVIVYDSWKKLIASGVPPLTLLKSKGVNLIDYKIYGESVQERLPQEYQEVEYIESTSTQYINTGIIPNQDTGFDIEFLTKNKVSSSGYGSIIGAREASSVNELQLTTFTNEASYLGSIRFGTGYGYNAGITQNRKMYCTLKNGVYTNNEGVTQNFDRAFTSPVPLTVFALNNNGSITQYGLVQLYSLKLYYGNSLIRDFVPCYRKSDNKIGLYDLVESQFYTNAGTGEFLKGSNLPTPEAPIEIESVGDKTKNLLRFKGLTEVHGVLADNTQPLPDLDEQQLYFGNGTGRYFPLPTAYGDGSIFEVGDNYVRWSTATAYRGPAYSVKVKPNTTYKYSHKDENGNYTRETTITVAYYDLNGNLISTLNLGVETATEYKSFTTTEDTAYVIINLRATNKNEVYTYYDLQLEEGIEVTQYEEFGYRVPIQVKNSGKNLVNIPYIDSTTTDDMITINCNLTQRIIVSCQEYPTLIANNSGVETSIWRLSFNYLDGTTQYITDDGLKKVGNYVNYLKASEENPIISISYRGTYIREGAYRGIQIEYGEVGNNPTSYEPYLEPIITNIYLNQPLRKIGDYADYIDYKNKKVVRNVGVLTFDGTEKIDVPSTANEGFTPFRFLGVMNTGKYPYLCNYFEYSPTYYNLSKKEALCIYPQTINGQMFFVVSNDRIPLNDTTAFKNWLAELYSKRTPLIVYYGLVTPTEETIDLPEISTFAGKTIIDVPTNTKVSQASVEYFGKFGIEETTNNVGGYTIDAVTKKYTEISNEYNGYTLEIGG